MTSLLRLLKDYGDEVEASLAFAGVDSRDLYRRGSGMTLRRLGVLLRALPADCPLYAALRKAAEEPARPPAEVIRSRQAAWEARNAARRAREEQSA